MCKYFYKRFQYNTPVSQRGLESNMLSWDNFLCEFYSPLCINKSMISINLSIRDRNLKG